MHPFQQLYDDPLPGVRQLPSSESDRLRAAIPVIFSAHAAVKTAAEHARNDKVMGSSLQCSVVLQVPESSVALELLREHASELADMLVVSSLSIITDKESVGDASSLVWQYTADFEVNGDKPATAFVMPPDMAKCPRCWRYVAEEDGLCKRCDHVVGHQ